MLRLLIFVSVLFMIGMPIISVQEKKPEERSNSQEQIEKLHNKYGILIHKAYFSIDEVRPFSILQSDKTLEIYQNVWVTPEQYLSKLNNSDLEQVELNLMQYLDSIPKAESNQIIDKIEHWCMAELQFEFLIKTMRMSEVKILFAMSNSESTKPLFQKYIQQSPQLEINNMSALQKNEAYYSVLNYVSSLKYRQQLQYYSEIYQNLSLTASK